MGCGSIFDMEDATTAMDVGSEFIFALVVAGAESGGGDVRRGAGKR